MTPAFKKSSIERGHYGPFVVFMVLLMVGEASKAFFEGHKFLADPQYWVKPAQTVFCAALLIYYWRSYDFGQPFRVAPPLLLGLAVGVAAFLLWLTPQFLFHAPERRDGFDPAFFGDTGWVYWLSLGFRLTRLVIVVPLVEEIFWRGFLMRWLIREDFTAVRFGTFQAKAFLVVALLFMLEHASADYPAALGTGLLYNFVAVRTQSLGACVMAHSVTNLLLGLFILRTGQWGFW